LKKYMLKTYTEFKQLITMTKINFIETNGEIKTVDAPIGLSVLEVAHKNDIDIEGACGGSLACSTCHVIVDEKDFDRLDPASDDEEDMLDLAFDLQKTSRLCCQIIVTSDLDGLTVKLPKATRNILLED
jgi:2Fe-2S ferredoxin